MSWRNLFFSFLSFSHGEDEEEELEDEEEGGLEGGPPPGIFVPFPGVFRGPRRLPLGALAAVL